MQRTGSTWVQDLLDSHPQVAAYGEIFLEYGRGFPDSERFGPVDIEYFESWSKKHTGRGGRVSRARHAIPYLKDFYRRRGDAHAAGFKLMYSQLRRNPMVAAYLTTRRVRVIHLTRANLLDVVLSHATSEARGQAHAWIGDAVREARVSLDPAATAAKLKALERQVALARALTRANRLPTLELGYENLVADASELDGALEFLGVQPDPGHPLSSTMQKLNHAEKRDLIENWNELSAALTGTRFERYLRD